MNSNSMGTSKDNMQVSGLSPNHSSGQYQQYQVYSGAEGQLIETSIWKAIEYPGCRRITFQGRTVVPSRFTGRRRVASKTKRHGIEHPVRDLFWMLL